MKNEEFTQRINTLVGDNRMQFSFDTLIPYTTLTNIQKGTEPRVSVVLAILKAYPNLSAEWLMRGTPPQNLDEREAIVNQNMEIEIENLKSQLDELRLKYKILNQMYDDKCAELAAQVPHVAYVLRDKNGGENTK